MITTWTTMLLTGLRGNGKTLKAVQMMEQFIAAGVPVFACNFNGLVLPGVQVCEDPHEWRQLPPGSVLFVDEAQRFFRSRRSGEPPQSITDMETQRHDGVRIVLLTQQPTYLDKHLRGLVDVHQHLVRRAGMQAAQVYEWERCRDEWDSPANLEVAEKSIWPFPRDLFGMYESAEVHTVKAKIPMRLKLVVLGLLLVIGLFWYVTDRLKPEQSAPPATNSEDTAAVSAAGDTPARSSRRKREPMSNFEYVAQMQARIPGAPWSAPVFDESNEVTEQPEVYCMIGETCRCITEQGTRYSMEQGQCRRTVMNGGIYNPFKRAREEWQRRDTQGEPGLFRGVGAGAPTVTPSPSIVLDSEAVTGHGAMTRAERFDPASDNGFAGGS